MKLRQRPLFIASSLAFALILFSGTNGFAEDASVGTELPQATSDFSTEAMMTGDWGGARTNLHDLGIDLGATEVAELFSNTSGGIQRQALYEGRLEMNAVLDFEKIFGWKGVTAFANAYQTHGRGLSGDDLNGNIMTISNIEAIRTTRLFDLWVQKAADDNSYSIRAGQIAADDEFTISQYGGTLINSVFGWPSSLAANMPSGGPAYPLATPGIRLHLGADDQPWALQTALFDGDPAGHNDNSGTAFNMDRGALMMSELAYIRNGGKDATGLPATYKLGAWYHTENAADLHDDNTGLSLAAPTSSGVARVHHGNYGLYGIVDQSLWANTTNPDQSVAAFARLFWNPSDRNLAAYQIDSGLNVKGLFECRKEDILGLGISYIAISDSASAFDRDTNANSGTPAPVRDYESVVELTYQAPLTPWLSAQPDFQYVMHPGGNIANPNLTSGTTPIKDAAIIGLRMVVKF